MVTTRDGNTAVRVDGLRDFRNELKALDPSWAKELQKVHKTIAQRAAEKARAKASGGTRQQAAAAAAIAGRASQTDASIVINTGSIPYANAAFWGAKRRTGWYAQGKYADSHGKQFPPWVGASWEVAQAGQGPYAINPALADYLPDLVDEYGRMVDVLAARAFPD